MTSVWRRSMPGGRSASALRTAKLPSAGNGSGGFAKGKSLLYPNIFAVFLLGLGLTATQSTAEILTLPCSFSPESNFVVEIDFERLQLAMNYTDVSMNSTDVRKTFPVISITDNFITAAGQEDTTFNGKVESPTPSDGFTVLVLDRKIGEFHIAGVRGRCQETGCDIGSMQRYSSISSCKVSSF